MAYNRRGQRNYSQGDYARRHIEEAAAFTREMGGVDQDVKKYFFDLPGEELHRTLHEYRRLYGQAAGDYAYQTFPAWQSGQRRMSGLVAKRLFALLPGRMSMRDKYSLVESLWRVKGPRSSNDFYVGRDSTPDEIRRTVENHFASVVVGHKIPDELAGRFSWLADGDVQLQQQLYNYYSSLEQPILMQGLAERLPLFLQQVKTSVGTSVAQNIRIGNHEVNLRFHSKAGKISTVAPSSADYGCLIWIAVAVIILLIYLAQK